jgi:hypothetical protein
MKIKVSATLLSQLRLSLDGYSPEEQDPRDKHQTPMAVTG